MAFQFVLIATISLAVVGQEVANDPKIEALNAATKEYETALKYCEANHTEMVARVKDLQDLLADEASMDALGDSLVKNKDSPTRDDIEHIHQTGRDLKKTLAALTHDSKHAARDVKHWARKVEKAMKHAGASEHGQDGFETLFGHREHYAEHMQDEVEHLGEHGEHYIEDIYRHIARRFEAKARNAERAVTEKADAEKAATEKVDDEKADAERAAERQAAEKAAEEERAQEKADEEKAAAEQAAAEKAAKKAAAEQSTASNQQSVFPWVPLTLAAQTGATKAARLGTAVFFVAFTLLAAAAAMRVYRSRSTEDSDVTSTYYLIA